jgi:hypothetical protein
VAEALDFVLDDEPAEIVRRMRARLATVGWPVPGSDPAVRLALANAIPKPVRAQLTEDLRLLVLPELWLATVGNALTAEPRLVLAAVPDAELLAAHTIVHDALAGRVKGAAARYLPGQWVPHCALTGELTHSQAGRAMSNLGAIRPLRAKVAAVGITDTRTGVFHPLRGW